MADPIADPEDWLADFEARIKVLANDQPDATLKAILLLCEISLTMTRAIADVSERISGEITLLDDILTRLSEGDA